MDNSVSEYLPPLTDDDRTIFINKKICDKLPLILSTLADWGSRKATNQNFENYLKNDKGFTDEKLKKMFKKDVNKLKNTSFSGFDMTFMDQLLPHLCDDIVESGSKEWESRSKNEAMVECQLKKLKDLRNNVMHEPEEGSIDRHFSQEVKKLATQLVENAGAKYNKDLNEVNDMKDNIEKLISSIRNTVMSEVEKNSFQYQKLIIKEGLPELKEKVKTSNVKSPYFKHVTGFYSLQLSVKNTVDGVVAEETISCRDVFDYALERDLQIIFIEGPTGAGKSSLMRQYQADILQKENDSKILYDSKIVQVPLLFNCRSLSCTTLVDLVGQSFPGLTKKLDKLDLLEVVLSQFKCIFLVDGVDEMNNSSRVLVENILTFLKNNSESICILTSRPHSVKIWEGKLRVEGLSHQTLTIKELETEEEQREFLGASCTNGERISATYETSDLNLQLPVFLSLYSYFFTLNPDSVKLWTSPVHIMRETVDNGLEVAQQRLLAKKVQNCEGICRRILERISFVSFCCLSTDKFVIEIEDFRLVKTKITEECRGLGIDEMDILTCLFPTSTRDSTTDEIEFFHKSQQEYVSAMYVGQQIVMARKNLKQIMFDAINEHRDMRVMENKRRPNLLTSSLTLVKQMWKKLNFDMRDFVKR